MWPQHRQQDERLKTLFSEVFEIVQICQKWRQNLRERRGKRVGRDRCDNRTEKKMNCWKCCSRFCLRLVHFRLRWRQRGFCRRGESRWRARLSHWLQTKMSWWKILVIFIFEIDSELLALMSHLKWCQWLLVYRTWTKWWDKAWIYSNSN